MAYGDPGYSEPPWPFLREGDMERFQAMAEDAIKSRPDTEWAHLALATLVRIRQLEGKCRSTKFPSRSGIH